MQSVTSLLLSSIFYENYSYVTKCNSIIIDINQTTFPSLSRKFEIFPSVVALLEVRITNVGPYDCLLKNFR